MVDLVGFSTNVSAGRVGLLRRQAASAFPSGADWGGCETWAGLRPATPDWKPILGRCGVENLWLDTGLGGLGFTIGCGTADLLAAMLSGRPPAIPVAPYALDARSRRSAMPP